MVTCLGTCGSKRKIVTLMCADCTQELQNQYGDDWWNELMQRAEALYPSLTERKVNTTARRVRAEGSREKAERIDVYDWNGTLIGTRPKKKRRSPKTTSRKAEV